MKVNEALGTHKLALAFNVDLIVWHPLASDTRPASDVLGPLLQGDRIDKLMLIDTQEKITILVVRGHLFFSERAHVELIMWVSKYQGILT